MGTASTRAAVIVGVNVPLTFGKETDITKTSIGMLVIWKDKEELRHLCIGQKKARVKKNSRPPGFLLLSFRKNRSRIRC